jgi:glyoxylase-like metal-dependent hydrolase (beta-lactamase superfamily II)
VRALRIAALAVACVLAAMVAVGWRVIARVTALPHPAPVASPPGVGPLAPERPAPEAVRGLELHLLYTAETTVPYGQFFRGLEGWVGAAALWKGGLQRETFWAPVAVAVIRHPRHGVVLVDAGLSREQTHPFRYYSVRAGGLNAGIWRDSANRIAADGDLIEQLARLGIAPGDVAHVVLTHLHEDHVGEVARFPAATVHVSRLEWEDRARVSYEPSFAGALHWDHFAFESGALGPFAASHDLFGDRSVVLLPTPGHTLGHSVVLVQLEEASALIAGDALYTLRHLDPEALAPFNYFGPQGLATWQDSTHRIAALAQQRAELVLVVPHDPFAYNLVFTRQAFADGRLTSPEWAMLRGEQAKLFDAAGRLRAEARPRWDAAAQRVASDIP